MQAEQTAPPAALPRLTAGRGLYAAAVGFSAALVFLVEPMAAKLVLPILGGSPAVWNTSLAFFQIALLAGYGYAHALQRVRSIRMQGLIHLAVLALAALALPLRLSGWLGDPPPNAPIPWLLGALALSVGAPFAALSATAPLVQAWSARGGDGKTPYALYAASNLGSLLALAAYPVVVEPSLTLHAQRWGWSLGYAAFAVVMLILVLASPNAVAPPPAALVIAPPVTWRRRLTWIALAAAPSSLMLGTTAHLTTDVASAPFLWVIPLGLYLATFIFAFQTRPTIRPDVALVFQALFAVAVLAILPFRLTSIFVQLPVDLMGFFFTALICHQALYARRPEPARLTEFYLWMSVGGVVGGAFNAFAAPLIFKTVVEYPLVLILAGFARPTEGQAPAWHWATLGVGVIAGLAAAVVGTIWGVHWSAQLLIVIAAAGAFLVRDQRLMFVGLSLILWIGAGEVGDQVHVLHRWRSFFGVMRQSETEVPELGGWVKMLTHGTTLHGAQAPPGKDRCRPLLYYAAETPIGQVFGTQQGRKDTLRIGVVGLGTGTSATYVRPGDRLTFFEIDPLVVKISSDPAYFSYTTQCARGLVDYVLGDARLTLARQPQGEFDTLLIDAFSSDAVPTHLLTVEAVRGYLGHLKPDGVLILHLSNRNLDLRGPAQAVAIAAGGHALIQRHAYITGVPRMYESAEDAVIVAKSEAALKPFNDDRWTPADPKAARPWTDDYVNVFGALMSQAAGH